MFLYLSDKIILSLPSFEMLSCNLDLTKTSYFGVGGIVTDDGENSRLMVCMETDCWIWKSSEWEAGPPMVENQKRAYAASSNDGAGGWLVTGGQDGLGSDFYDSAMVFKD